MSASIASARPMASFARYGLIVALIAVFSLFSAVAPTFLSTGNLQSILVNNFTLLAIVSIAMTFAVAAGGIDLSVGTAVDFASFAFVSGILAGLPVPLAALAGLGAGVGRVGFGLEEGIIRRGRDDGDEIALGAALALVAGGHEQCGRRGQADEQLAAAGDKSVHAFSPIVVCS